MSCKIYVCSKLSSCTSHIIVCFLLSFILPPRVNKVEANKRIFKKNKFNLKKNYDDFTAAFQL